VSFPHIPHSTGLRGKGCHQSAKAACSEDLQIEEPVACGYSAAFGFHATLTGTLGATLIGHQVVQVSEFRAELSTAIEMYQAMEMTFWLPETEAALAQVQREH
jgi:hypothetical protein